MVGIATGLWWDYSRSAASAATLTLSTTSSNILLSSIAFLVTLAGASAWNITAFILHSLKTREQQGAEHAQIIDLTHQVNLRNSKGALSTLWEAVKIHRAWKAAKKPPPQLLKKTSMLAIPAFVIWAGFALAAIFTSNVANKAYGTSIARLKERNCGLWSFDAETDEGYIVQKSQLVNDTLLARTYASNFYSNENVSATAKSLFVRQALPYTINTIAPCPIPAGNRCFLGSNTAFQVTSDRLDSHEALGINAKAEDRILLQVILTCSPVSVKGLFQVTETSYTSYLDFFMGDISLSNNRSTNITYRYDGNTASVGYFQLLTAYSNRYSYVGGSKDSSVWRPHPDFARQDADMSVNFLSQNAVAYLNPVFGPMFSANGTKNSTSGGSRMLYLPDQSVSTMVCADQYVLCNPSTSACTKPDGVLNLREDIISDNTIGLNVAQRLTAFRLILTLINSSSFNIIQNLGVSALWSNSRVFLNLSPGLPSNQWQTEVLGWFQTGLARIQGYVVDFASNEIGLSPYAVEQSGIGNRTMVGESAGRRGYQYQCKNQLVQTAGEVQNFNFVAVVVIVVLSVFLILLDLALESIVNLILHRRGWKSPSKRARQADDKLHLLRMALGHSSGGKETAAWKRGEFGVPVSDKPGQFYRPTVCDDLVSYTPQSGSVTVVEVNHAAKEENSEVREHAADRN
ncbi:hypothetical protein PWT90_07863 [Aphanocladium album]|nr:hypothetical protein PWT90_07863 [Aphanocladium album]